MQQTVLNDTNQPRPFATTGEKYSTEYANGKVTGSNFPHYEIQSLPGYSERGTPSLSGSDVTNVNGGGIVGHCGGRKVYHLA